MKAETFCFYIIQKVILISLGRKGELIYGNSKIDFSMHLVWKTRSNYKKARTIA